MPDPPNSPSRKPPTTCWPSSKAPQYVVKSVGTREKKRNPVAPFITSTLQQESSRKLRFSVKRTMMLAQRLYEGIELGKEGAVGLITYMRTDSTRVSEDALSDARHYIAERYGTDFLPDAANIYKSKNDAQDAHEAIRPTSMAYAPDDVAQVPGRRRAEALPPHLEPLRRLADDARRSSIRPLSISRLAARTASNTSSAPPAPSPNSTAS